MIMMLEWLTPARIATFFCALLAGGSCLFMLFITPLLKRYLNAEIAPRLLRRLLPLYYYYCIALGLCAGFAASFTPQRHEAVSLAILAASFAFARAHLLRAADAMRNSESQPRMGARSQLFSGLLHSFHLAQLLAAGILLLRLI